MNRPSHRKHLDALKRMEAYVYSDHEKDYESASQVARMATYNLNKLFITERDGGKVLIKRIR